jgi:hypothetical protein
MARLQAIYRLNAIPIPIPVLFSTEIEKSVLKFLQKHKAKSNPEQKRATLEILQY